MSCPSSHKPTAEVIDFEKIDVEIQVYDGKFYLTPTRCKLVGKNRTITVDRPEFPLSFNHHLESQLWKKQLRFVEHTNPAGLKWAVREIARVVSAHQTPITPNVLEPDLLRASGPLNVLGVALGPYLGKGIDCVDSVFQFLELDPYEVPVEVKKKSSGFKYQQTRYAEEQLSRAVVLCVNHDLRNVPHNVDVIELTSLGRLARL